jgi:hypothetical protein
LLHGGNVERQIQRGLLGYRERQFRHHRGGEALARHIDAVLARHQRQVERARAVGDGGGLDGGVQALGRHLGLRNGGAGPVRDDPRYRRFFGLCRQQRCGGQTGEDHPGGSGDVAHVCDSPRERQFTAWLRSVE